MGIYISDENGNLTKYSGLYSDSLKEDVLNKSQTIDQSTTKYPSNKAVYDFAQQKTEVIYDRSSSDPNINWGYTGGIRANSTDGTTITGKDFSGYKYLIFDCSTGSTENIWTTLYIPANQPNRQYSNVAYNNPYQGATFSNIIRIDMYSDGFKLRGGVYTMSDFSCDNTGKINKIVGVK